MHDEYWRKVRVEAENRLVSLFGDNWVEAIRDIVGDDNGIDGEADAVKVLAYILKHGNPDEVACAVISLGDWRQARHELAERGQADAPIGGNLGK